MAVNKGNVWIPKKYSENNSPYLNYFLPAANVVYFIFPAIQFRVITIVGERERVGIHILPDMRGSEFH